VILGQRVHLRAEAWVIFAQLLVLGALLLGLQFAIRTTGGTLFLFSTIAPLLVLASISIVVAHAILTFRARHRIFDFEMLQPGQIVFREGDPSGCAYFIQQGEVEVLRDLEGHEQVLARLGVGEYFGEMGLLSDRPRNATIRALAETRVAVVGKQNFLNMLFAVPSVREDILNTAYQRATRPPKQ
jgi:hypothetical protein